MKRVHLVTARKIKANGVEIEGNTIVGTMESNVSSDILLAGISLGTIIEVPADVAGASPESESPSEELPEVESEPEADSEPAVENSAQLADTSSELSLIDAGLSEGLASRLAENEITTVEGLGRFLASGGDLVDLDKVGRTYAKQIKVWWESRQ